jgi:hypothetical protein
MNLGIVVIVALVAAISFLASGYLIGLQRGKAARDRIRAELAHLGREKEPLAQQLQEAQVLLNQRSVQLAALQQGGRDDEPLRSQIDKSITRLLEPLLEHDLQTRELRDAVNGLLRPMVERERLGLELTRLDANLSGRSGLSQLLSTMAKRAGFSTVLVTDNSGLPLAESEGAKEVDVLGASIGLLLNLIDRIATNGGAAPLAVVLRDNDNRIALHRFFKVDGQRYVLTAVTSGNFLPPDVLDPALTRIEQVLTRHALG